MLNGLQATFQAPLGAMLTLATQGAQALYHISVLCSMPFIIFAIIGAIQNGGGAGLIKRSACELRSSPA